jgi:ubiquinone/menaquinone biosynthesis C-methylase UbiE
MPFFRRVGREGVRSVFENADEHQRTRYEAPALGLRTAHARGCFEAMLPEPTEGGAVLEVGAGTGFFTIPTLQRGFHVTATDVNGDMVRFLDAALAEVAAGDRYRVAQADVFQLPYPEASFDGVVCMKVLPRFSEPRDHTVGLREMARVLRPNGWIVFNVRNARSPASLWRRRRGMSARSLEPMLRAAGLVVERRVNVHVLDRQTTGRLPRWVLGWVAWVDERAATIPLLPFYNVLYRARRGDSSLRPYRDD